MIAIVDYGMGNLRSVLNAFEAIGADARLTARPEDLREASAVVVPGVGAFCDGMANLRSGALVDALEEEVIVRRKPYLGICLGLQFLAREGLEHESTPGLGWVGGVVRRIEASEPGIKVPHMGWHGAQIDRPSILFKDMAEPVFYFVHSYHLAVDEDAADTVVASCWHGERLIAAVERDNVFAVQFHPEKSQECGLQLLRNFTSLA